MDNINETPPLSEFTTFSQLPRDLRFLIWELVPRPTRIIGHLPCSKCSSKDGIERCAATEYTDWRLQYIVLPRHQAIFPPLHACQESRSVWLPRYYQPLRYLDLYEYDTNNVKIPGYNLRFNVPFISYSTDIITVFNP